MGNNQIRFTETFNVFKLYYVDYIGIAYEGNWGIII